MLHVQHSFLDAVENSLFLACDSLITHAISYVHLRCCSILIRFSFIRSTLASEHQNVQSEPVLQRYSTQICGSSATQNSWFTIILLKGTNSLTFRDLVIHGCKKDISLSECFCFSPWCFTFRPALSTHVHNILLLLLPFFFCCWKKHLSQVITLIIRPQRGNKKRAIKVCEKSSLSRWAFFRQIIHTNTLALLSVLKRTSVWTLKKKKNH